MKGKDVEYRLIVMPDSRDVEAEINRILKENEEREIEILPLQVVEKYSRSSESLCPKCGGQIIKGYPTGKCKDCQREYDEETMKKNERTSFTRAGNFFVQQITIKRVVE